MDLAGLQLAFATTAGAVLARIGQHHALAQRGDQYVFPFPDPKGFPVSGNGNFE